MSEFHNFSDDGIVGYFSRGELTNKIINQAKSYSQKYKKYDYPPNVFRFKMIDSEFDQS